MGINTIKERKRLENIKEQLEKRREIQREAETEKKMIMKQLKENYDCSSIKELEEILEEAAEANENMEKEIVKRTEKLINDMKEEGLM